MPPKTKAPKKVISKKNTVAEVISQESHDFIDLDNLSESTKKMYDNLSKSAKKRYKEAMAFLASDEAKSLTRNAIIIILAVILTGKIGMSAARAINFLANGGVWLGIDGLVFALKAQLPDNITLPELYESVKQVLVAVLSHLGGSNANNRMPPGYFNFRGTGLKKIKVPKKVIPPIEKEVKKEGLYYQITESPTAKNFYDIITSDEAINFSKEFVKALASIWLYRTVYNAAKPTPPAVETQTEATEPVRRGVVVQGRRGVVVQGRRSDDDFGVAPEDVEESKSYLDDAIRSSGVDISNLSEDERVTLHDFAAVGEAPSAWEEVISTNNRTAELIENLKKTVHDRLRAPAKGEGLSFKISPETKEIGKEAFKALLLAGLAGAVGHYSLNSAKDYISPQSTLPSDRNIEGRTRNWTNEVKNRQQMHNILSEFDDLSEDVSSLSSNFYGSYGLGLKKTKDTKAIFNYNNPLILKINAKIKEGIKYIYDKSPSKETILLFISVLFALGTALIFANSQPLTDALLNGIMDFKRILEDCARGGVTLNSVQDYVTHYLGQFARQFGGKLNKSDKRKSIKMEQITPQPDGFYEKRIKPMAKKAYDIITSDETITVAKTLAQLVFLSLIMYGIKEAGVATYGAMTPSEADMRTARQDLEALADREIASPTYYTEASGRYRGQNIEYDKSQYPREYPQDIGVNSRLHEDYNTHTAPSKINRMLAEAESDIYRSEPKIDKLIELLKKEDPVHIKNLMLKHPVLTDITGRKPHKFTTEFAEHFPTEEELKQFKEIQKASGKGLKEDAIKLSKDTMTKLKKIAKKIYDKIKSEEGQNAVKGLTVATITAGLVALIHSRMGAHTSQLSASELKEQYMNRLGEDILFQ